MKRTSQICCALTLLFMSLCAVPSANAVGLLGFGPPPAVFKNSAGVVITVPGLPAWFQDQNGVAVQPCLDAIPCGLVGRLPAALGPLDPGFDLGLPLVYPDNFPDEAFYFAADVEFPVVGNVPGLLSGPFTAQFRVTQEFVFLDATRNPTYPGAPVAVPAPFQRLRFIYFFNGINPTTVPGLISGDAPAEALAPGTSFKLTTPWGDPTFNLQDALTNTKAPVNPTNMKCETAFQTGDTKCLFTRDIFSVPPNFAPALAESILPTDFGGSPMSTFLKDPGAAPGFLGSAANVPLSFTGAPAGRANLFSVTDPMGNSGSSIALKDLTGKKFGMEVAPLAFDFVATPVTIPVTTSPATTITVTNPDTLSALTLGTLALTGTNPDDFAITADTCSTATLPAASAGAPPSACTVTVAFAPKRLAPAPEVTNRTAMVNIQGTFATGVAAPPRLAALTGTGLLVPLLSVTDSTAPATDQQVPFGSVLVGASADATITATNNGSADLVIGQIASTIPLTPPFSIQNDTCSGKTIAPAATCTLTVRFAPTASASASGMFDMPSNGLPTVTVSVNGTGATSITTTGSGNNPPSNPVLVSPTNALTGVPTTMTFTWKKSQDPDVGDVVTYHMSYSTDQNFTTAQTVDVASAKSTGLLFASLGSTGGGIILMGFVAGNCKRRSRITLLGIITLLYVGTLLTSCGGSGGGSTSTTTPPTEQVMSRTVTGLAANTTYYWKVVADDGRGGMAASETFSFKTQ